MSWRRFLERLLGKARDSETQRQLGLGGASLADELRRHRPGPHPDNVKSSFHDWRE